MSVSAIGRSLSLILLLGAAPGRAEDPRPSVLRPGADIEVRGISRTDIAWLTRYLGLKPPLDLASLDLERLRQRILTTRVFSSASVEVKGGRLVITVEEKWTAIPVIRGQSGGGTPLRVLGGYDTHVAGRHLTLGGEGRRYGDAPWGGVAYFRKQPVSSDDYFLGVELWRDERRRYDPRRDAEREIRQNRVRWRWMIAASPYWRWGADVRWRQSDDRRLRFSPWLTAVYDDVRAHNIVYEGLRLVAALGPGFTPRWQPVSADFQGFLYQPLGPVRTAMRLWAGHSAGQDFSDLYFLGGFDSVRGYRDGVQVGANLAVLNTEVRHLLWRSRYLWLEAVAFVDQGTAWTKTPDYIASWGGGLRFAIPQVYRLVFRVDWARGFGASAGDISLGLNQFFQPYRPL